MTSVVLPKSLLDRDNGIITVEDLRELVKQSRISASSDQTGDETPSEPEVVEKPEDEPIYQPVGTIASCVNLYESTQCDWQGKVAWTRKYPEGIEDPPENAESEQYALLIRNKKCYDDPRKKLTIDSLIVQSTKLKELLGRVFENYTGLNTEVERLEFLPPFKPFVHRWEQFAEVRKNEKDELTRRHADLLWDVLSIELKDSIREKNDNVALGVVQFKNIWTIYEPDTLIYSRDDDGNDRIYKLNDAEFKNSRNGVYLELDADFIDWDGSKFGFNSSSLAIFPFSGTRDILKLPVFPLKYHPQADSVRQKCLERGREFEKYAGYHFKFYDGPALQDTCRGKIRRNIKSRVIIDTLARYTFNPNSKQTLVRIGSESAVRSAGFDTDTMAYDYGDDKPDLTSYEPVSLSDEHLVLATNILHAYSLKEKAWLDLYIPYVSEIKWNEDAFDSLVAPPAEKELVLAFTRSQGRNGEIFDDYIDNKGKGIVMLLSGKPGVGKTLTAESVAEALKVPLYSISSGDLGNTSYELEQSLSQIMEMTTRWSACLLLDEADVYLEARTKHDISRNAIVAIFLRMLEYYQGILFLTTNLVEHMDPAFESRIHLTLEYSDLDAASRRTVWVNFIARCRRADVFADQELDRLAQVKLNGRQIKNLMKSAQLLASDQDVPLGFKHIQAVLDVRANNMRIPEASDKN